MKKELWGILYGILLAAFTTFVMLDTFVISEVYEIVETRESAEEEPVQTASEEGDIRETEAKKSKGKKSLKRESTESGSTMPGSDTEEAEERVYKDENIEIVLTRYREYASEIYVAEVKLDSAEYLRTAFAKNSYGKNVTEKTSVMAENNNAILAINGDYYGAQSKGYVIRSGVLYRDIAVKDKEDLVIYGDGSFEIIVESEVAAAELEERGAEEVLSFGPALVRGGEIAVSEKDEVGKAMASNPRTAIGIIDELHYVFVVSDGRTQESEGLSLYQLAAFLQSLGVELAYNLDGGGSSTMYFMGEIINNPTTNGNDVKERSVSDIVYIGY